MPFIGKQPNAGFASIVKDDFTADGSTTTFTLSKQVANANDIAVFVGNVRQEPTDAYTVNGTTLTMSAAPASAINFYVLHIAGTVESSVVPADGTISSAKIVSGAVTDAKIASGITATKVYPNKIRASDLDTTTQGSSIMMWEHIETKIAQSDGDTNVQTTIGSNEHINFDVTAVKHLYAEYWIKFHWMAPITNLETADTKRYHCLSRKSWEMHALHLVSYFWKQRLDCFGRVTNFLSGAFCSKRMILSWHQRIDWGA